MNHYEEELQNSIASGRAPEGEELDIEAYQHVFRALSSVPDTKLSREFPDKIVARVIEKKKRDALRDMFWLGSGIFLLVVAFVVAAAITGFKLELGFLKDMSSYTGIFIFGVVFILLLGWLEKRLVLRRHTEG